MEVDAREGEPIRCEELWFEDGNVVLQAGNTQYRVYRGALAKHSPVFRDMFSFPQPPDSELVEGCVLVRLPDPAVEISQFLSALFDPQFFLPFPAHTTFKAIFGCLRLSHKYQVDYLRQRALVHLSSVYRTKLDAWDERCYIGRNRNCLPSMISTWSSGKSHVNICAIQLAREVEAIWILPGAFYALTASASDWTDICGGVDYEGIQARLSLVDQLHVATGFEVQARNTLEVMTFLSNPPEIVGCTSPKQCPLLRFRTVHVAHDFIQNWLRAPLTIWTDDDWDLLEDLCPTCLDVLKQRHRDSRQRVWDRLPQVYGLPSWDELETMKMAAIGTDRMI